jgi:hypothetical protein
MNQMHCDSWFIFKKIFYFLSGIKKALHLHIRLTLIWFPGRVRTADLMINSNFKPPTFTSCYKQKTLTAPVILQLSPSNAKKDRASLGQSLGVYI